MHHRAIIDTPVSNFPSSYPWYKRLGSNITYYFSQIPLRPRKNHLTKHDIHKTKELLQSGDIILCGNFQHLSGLFIDGVVTHAIGHLQRGKCIHAYAHGVSHIHLRHILRTYDTLVLLRPRWHDDTEKNTYKMHLIRELGKPYDFFFGVDEDMVESYYCTKLINESLLTTGYDTGLSSIHAAADIIDTSLDAVFRAHRVLTPDEMIYGNFDVIYTSENIEKSGGRYRLRGGRIGQIIPESREILGDLEKIGKMTIIG